MAHDVQPESALQALLDGGLYTLARIFRLTRLDGTVLRLTEHDTELVIREGYLDGLADPLANDYTYTPSDGLDTTAARQAAAMRSSTVEASGVFSSSAIAEDDLAAGKYENATLDIAWVDWRFPWVGLMRHHSYRLSNFIYDAESWSCEAINRFSELRRKTGRVYGRTCWHAFMDDGCGIARTNGTTVFPAQVVRVVSDDGDFQYEAGATWDATDEVDDFFRAGHIKWLTGNNAGKVYPVRQSNAKTTTPSDAQILLQFPTRAAIQVGDTFDLIAGCDKTLDACKSTSLAGGVNNHTRFGGFPHMPGTTRVAQTGQLTV